MSLQSVTQAAARAKAATVVANPFRKGDGMVLCHVTTAHYQQPPRVRKHVEWVFGVITKATRDGVAKEIQTYQGRKIAIEGNPTRYGFKAEVMARPLQEIINDLGTSCFAEGDDGAAILRNRLLDFKKGA